MTEQSESKSKDQMFLVTAQAMTKEQRDRLASEWRRHCESVDMHGCVLDSGMSVEVDRNYGPKLDALIEEQRKTNQLLMLLVETLAEEVDEDNQEPGVYLDGTPTSNA